MSEASMHHPFDDEGNPVDASFRLENENDGFAMFYASRGGTKGTPGARNIEYHVGLALLIERLKNMDATITDILLDSAATRLRPAEERRLNLAGGIHYPVALSTIADPGAFRRLISDAQKDVLTAPGRDAKHGNRMRSIRMSFRLPTQHASLDVDRVTQRLVSDEAARPTQDSVELKARASRIRRRGPVARPRGNQSPSPVDSSMGRRFNRSPVVAAYVLQRADGQCELCSNTSFLTDVGDAYLEIHHVVQLAAGGPDTPENTVAVCANCHRELHFGVNRGTLTALLYERVPELERVVVPTLERGCSSVLTAP